MTDQVPAAKVTSLDQVPAWFREEFEKGYVPMDEPPGFEEAYYAAWVRVGGKAIPPAPVTADDL